MKKTSRILALVLSLLLCIPVMSVSAASYTPPESGQCGNDMYWEYDYNTSTLTLSGSGDMFNFWLDTPWANLYVENIVFDGNITSIGNNAFRSTGISEIAFPDTLTRIGEHAFAECLGITDISLPSSMRLLCKGAFYGCEYLQTVNIEEGLEYVGEDAFTNCYMLLGIIYPFTLRQLDDCLVGCEALEFFGIPPHVYFNEINRYSHPSLSEIYAKIDCEESNSALEIAQNTGARVYEYDPYYGEMDTSLPWYIPEDMNVYPNAEFTDWSYDAVTKTLTISCDGAMVDFDGGMYPWDNIALEIENLVVEDSVTRIGDYAFAYLSELKTATIGTGVQDIGYGAFICTPLREVTMQENGFYTSPNGTYILDKSARAVVVGTSRASMSASVGIERIAECAFDGRGGLKSVSIPEGVYEIAANAFSGSDIESVSFPSTLSDIGDMAFSACAELGNINFKSVRRIGMYAFSDCPSMTAVILPDTVWEVGSHAFHSSDNITHLTVGRGMTEILGSPFNEMHGLKSILVPETVTMASEGEFSSCPLERIYGIPGSYIDGMERYWGGVFMSIENYSAGDIDGDGTVNASDYTSVKRAVLGSLEIEPAYFIFADVNSDGEINASDYTLVKRAVLGTYKLD